MENNGWIIIGDELSPDGRQVDFYSPEWDEVFCGCRYGERWYDETNHAGLGKEQEIRGVAHWRPRPKKPFEE